MVAVCNKNLAFVGGALDIWIRNVNKVNISNAIVIALDDETEDFCQKRQMKSIQIPVLVCLRPRTLIARSNWDAWVKQSFLDDAWENSDMFGTETLCLPRDRICTGLGDSLT